MYFRFNRRYDLLTVGDDFAHLRAVKPNGDLVFDLYYNVNPGHAVEHEALTVKVTVQSRTIKQKPVLENTHTGFVDTRKLVENVLTQVPTAKSAIKQQSEFVVATHNSDISAHINNEVVGQLKAKVHPKNIQQLNKSTMKLVQASEIKAAADAKPVLQQVAHQFVSDVDAIHSASIDQNPTRLMHDMIIRQGLDPSHILQMTHRSVPSVDSVGGILRSTRAPEFEESPATKLLNFHIFAPGTHLRPTTTRQVPDSKSVHILVNEPKVTSEISTSVLIPRHSRFLDGKDQSHFFVKFELLNGRTGVAVDSVVRALDVARHVQLYNTPKKPPVVKVTKSEVSSRANLEIKQVDPGATAVRVYKKNLLRAVVETDDYSLIGTYDVKHNEQSLLVQVDVPTSSTAIYRVVPVGAQGTLGFEYTNVVVRPKRFKPVKALSLTAQPIDIGVRLEARHIPQKVVAIEFKARNKTIFEKEFRNVGGSLMLVDDAVRTSDFVTVVDRDVAPNNIYEYVARLVYESGTSEESGNAVTEFMQPTPGKVDTKIENLVVDQIAEPNVTFTITTNIIDNNLDVVKTLLQRRDIYELFKGDVTREREFLKDLIAHNVQRVDLTTGRRDDFGIVTSLSFSDNDLRKNQAIPALQLGHRYRYEVTALLRAPETMFETLTKEKVDAVTKKTYAFKPAKFLHPVTLKRGVIVSSSGLKTRYSKEPLAHGAIGAIESVEVSFDIEPAKIVDPSAAKFDKYLNVITWKVQGSVDQVDHFLIMKDVHGVRTMIGKAHSEFPYGNCQYLHPVTRRDEGSFEYVIVPVFNDYKTGTSVVTNNVAVESLPKVRKLV